MSAAEQRFTALYVRYADAVRRYAVRRVSAEVVDDVVSSVFTTVWRRFGETDTMDDPLPWIYGIAKFTLANEHRAVSRRLSLVDRVARVSGALVVADHAQDLGGTDALAEAFERLGEPDREVLRLVAWEELSAGEAAAVLGIGRATFSMRVSRARRRLRSELTGSADNATSTSRSSAHRSDPERATRPVRTERGPR